MAVVHPHTCAHGRDTPPDSMLVVLGASKCLSGVAKLCIVFLFLAKISTAASLSRGRCSQQFTQEHKMLSAAGAANETKKYKVASATRVADLYNAIHGPTYLLAEFVPHGGGVHHC